MSTCKNENDAEQPTDDRNRQLLPGQRWPDYSMNLLSSSDEKKSRLQIVLETFALLGAIMSWFVGNIIPLLVAGGLFCITALSWRTEAQRQKYRSGWIALALCAFAAGTAAAAYFKR
jgi:hypothetical protein